MKPAIGTLQSCLLLLAISVAITMPAWAAAPADSAAKLADMSLQQLMQLPVELVAGASRYEQKVTRAPASVTIVTADDIRKFGYRTVADILRSTPGFYITDNRYYTTVGIRGFSRPGDLNTGILMLLDGHRVNDILLNLMLVAREGMIDADMISRVEIIRGPSSSVYGNSAFFGVINVISKRGTEIEGLRGALEAGSLNTREAQLTYGKQYTNGIELTASGSWFTTDGEDRLFYPEYASPDTNNGFAVNSDNETATRGFATLSYKDFTLSAAYSERHKRVPTAPFGTAFNTGKFRVTDTHGYADLKYEHAVSAELEVTGRISYDWYPYEATFPYQSFDTPTELILNRDVSVGRWARSEVQLTRRILGRHTLVFGAEYQKNLRQYQANYDQDPFTSYLNIDHSSSSYAVYSQGEFALAEPLLLNAGVRYDHFDSFGSTVNPRIGLIWNARESTTIKALYGEAFRAPNDYELNYESTTYEKNAALEPERIRTYEVLIEQYLPRQMRLSAAAYHYDINGLISQGVSASSGLIQFQNVSQVEANGLELQFEVRTRSGALARASYALQRTEDADTRLVLSNSPRHLGKLNLSVPAFGSRVMSSVELQYNGDVVTTTRQRDKGYLLLNATVLARPFGNNAFEASASLYNLFDTRYSTPGSANTLQDTIEQNGRMLRVKVAHTF
jgi:outer membrane receptor for ferrienterochelin and colicins